MSRVGVGSAMQASRWNREAEIRQRLASEGLGTQAWSNGPGDIYGAHRHDYDKVIVAAVGSIAFELPELGDRISLAAGDRLHLPAGTLHAAVVGPAGVTCLEAHLRRGALGSDPQHLPGWADTAQAASETDGIERA